MHAQQANMPKHCSGQRICWHSATCLSNMLERQQSLLARAVFGHVCLLSMHATWPV